jgi:hypothetical protein
MKVLLLLGALVLGLLAGCNIRKPFVREEDPWVVRGTRAENGDELVSRHVLRPFMVSVTPIGPMDGDHFTEYALRSGARVTRLEFLDEEARAKTHPDFSREIIAIPRSDRWAASWVKIQTREMAELTILVFDRQGIRATRTFTQVRRQYPMSSFGPAGCLVSLDDATRHFRVETATATLRYDPVADRVITQPD